MQIKSAENSTCTSALSAPLCDKENEMIDNHYQLFAATVRRALLDVRCENQRNKESAKEFLDTVFPSWQRELERCGRPSRKRKRFYE